MKLPYPPQPWPVILHAPMGFGDGDGEDNNSQDDDEVDDGVEETTTTTQEPSADEVAEQKALERQARAQGWRPKAEFKPDGTAEWVDAATFLERGAKFKRNMQRQIDQLEAARARDAKTLAQFKKFHEDAMAAKQRDIDTAISKARLDRQEAIRNGEDEAALALEDRIDTLKEEKAKLKAESKDDDKPELLPHEIEAENQRKARAVAEGKEPLPPAMRDWLDDGNTWFRDNARMRGYALAIGDELRASGDKSMDREFLDKVTEQMHKDFPEFFKKKPEGNPLRQRAGTVEGTGGRGNAEAQSRTARDLPKEDRDLMRKFVKEGLMTEEAFLKNYRW